MASTSWAAAQTELSHALVEFIAAEGVAEVGVAGGGVVDGVAGGAFFDLDAVVDDQGAVADLEGLRHVVIGDQDGFSEFDLEAADLALEVFNGDRVDAGEGLI